MAMDISSLGLPRAVIGRQESAKTGYKITSEQSKAMLIAAKDSGEIRDLFEASGESSAMAATMANAAGGTVQRICNYSTDAFFRKDMPEQIDEDGGYTIRGVRFSEAELQQARNVLQAAADSITAGPGRNTNLDYRNYAQMAVAENAVSVYAKNSLNEDQQTVVNAAMREYNDGLRDMQDQLLGARTPTDGSVYYGSRRTLTQEDADLLTRLKTELSRLTGRQYSVSKAGDNAGYDQIATNKSLMEKIGTVFRNADLASTQGMRSALQSYANLVGPAYSAQGISSADLSRVISNDTASLQKMFTTILSKGHRSIDMAF